MFLPRRVAALGFLISVCGCQPAQLESESSDSQAFVTVKVESVRRGAVSESVEALGRVEALPDHLAILTTAVEGHVEAILVTQGDTVKKGQPIVELDRSVAEADLAEKSAARDALRASLILLKSLPRLEEIRSHELAVEQAKVAVERARSVLESLEGLRTGGGNLASKQQLYDARKAYEAADYQHQAAVATLNAMMIGPRPEAVAEAEAKIKTAEGLVEFSRAHLAFHTIRSPIDGALESITCHPGQTLSIGSPIGEVVDTRQVYATVWLSPRLLQGVSVGLEAEVRPAEGAADAKRDLVSLSGKVEFIGRVADPQTGNLPVRVGLNNSNGQLALGESIHATIDRGQASPAFLVPVAAVLDLGEGPVLEVVRDGKTVVLHPRLGKPREGWMTVSDTDLKEGEKVIVDGGYSLPEGTPVRIAEVDEPKAVARAEQQP